MSHSEYDAWLWEKDRRDWPFERWLLPDLDLRTGHEYLPRFSTWLRSKGINSLVFRLVDIFKADMKHLRQALKECESIVGAAIDHSESEAHDNWLCHEVWLPVIDETIEAADEPAEMFVQSLLITESDDFNKSNLCAAIGLWCAGEWAYFKATQNELNAERMLIQVSIALAEAEFYSAKETARLTAKRAASERARKAAVASHTEHHNRKLRAQEIWQSRQWLVQADAERKIASECHISLPVAGRWIREFKNAITRDSSPQSKHPAMRRL